MASMTPYERETIILYNDAEDAADIHNHDRVLQRHIEKMLGIKPYFKRGITRGYEIPKTWLRYPRKPSEKWREASKKALNARGGFITRKNKVSSGMVL